MSAGSKFPEVQSATELPSTESLNVDSLFEAVYIALRGLARNYLSEERENHTLQPTALVHEAYLRLVGNKTIVWENRAQFFYIAAQVMRHILVDHARKHNAQKREGGAPRIYVDDVVGLSVTTDVDLIALDDALRTLSDLDEEQHRIVELRYFGGLTIKEVAEVLNVSEMTVSRRWKTAKLWLHHELAKN